MVGLCGNGSAPGVAGAGCGAGRELAVIERKLDGLYDAIADGLRSPGLNEKLQALETRRDSLRAIVEKPAPVRLHGNLAEHYRRKMAALAVALEDPALRDRTIGLLRDAVERVAIREEPAGFTISLDGAIAGMVSLALGQAAGTERAVLDERTACL